MTGVSSFCVTPDGCASMLLNRVCSAGVPVALPPRPCTNAGNDSSSWCRPSSNVPSEPFTDVNVPHSCTMSPDVVVGVDAGVVLGVGAGDRPGTGVDPALPGSSGFPEHAIPSANDNNVNAAALIATLRRPLVCPPVPLL